MIGEVRMKRQESLDLLERCHPICMIKRKIMFLTATLCLWSRIKKKKMIRCAKVSHC